MTKSKLLLVYPPLTIPTSPPLGVALLKAYINVQLENWRTEILDLNLLFYENVIGGLPMGEKLDYGIFPEGAIAEILLARSAEVFKTPSHPEFYTNPAHYDLYADIFLRFSQAYAAKLNNECSQTDAYVRYPLIVSSAEMIASRKPDVVGFSLFFSNQIAIAVGISTLLRKRYGIKVIMGGAVFASAPETFMTHNPQAADVVISGEGEQALVQYLREPESLEKVPGAVYMNDGTVLCNPASFSHELDRFPPPDFSDTPPQNYFSPEPVIPLLLSRGCYWRRCSFCAHYKSAGMTYRQHSIDYIMQMLRDFTAKGYRHFAFIDEMISPAFFRRLAEAIMAGLPDIAYYALAKPEKAFSKELLTSMAASGCKYILWGLESASQRVLELMDKGLQIDVASRVFRDAHAAGIANHVFIICGFPTETEAEFGETVKFIVEMKDVIYSIHRGPFTLQKGSPVHSNPEKFGITAVSSISSNPLDDRSAYNCSGGMTPVRARQVLESVQPLFRKFNPYARHLASLRDHALLVYSKRGKELRPDLRTFPEVIFPG